VSADSQNFLASRVSMRIGCLALALLAISAWGQSPSPPSDAGATFSPEIDALCPEAVRELAELRSRTKPPRVPTTVTRPALRENLLLMAKQDQEARAFPISSGGHIDPGSPEVVRMRETDSANLKRLKHIVNQDGFPTAEMVGLDGVSAAWLLAIHAGSDPDFQEKVLKLTSDHVRREPIAVAAILPGRFQTAPDLRPWVPPWEIRSYATVATSPSKKMNSHTFWYLGTPQQA
jgi:hypothetical protein